MFAVGGVEAQLLDQPTPPQLQKAGLSPPFAGSFQPFPRPYVTVENGSTSIYDTIFDSYRTDPKFLAGVQLRPNLAIEAGYGNLLHRGFHFVDYGRAAERAGALGTTGSTSHVAAKLTVPVDDRLSAYGKLGLAYSQRNSHDEAGISTKDIDVGPYANIGAKYKLNEKASISGEVTRAGDTSSKFGNASNATGVSAKLKLGF